MSTKSQPAESRVAAKNPAFFFYLSMTALG